MRNVLRAAMLCLLVVSVVAACASGGATPGGAEQGAAAAEGAVVLRVHNTDTGGQTLVIFLVPQAGVMTRLGTVAPMEHLTVPHTAGEGRFQLHAERPDGSTVTSPHFNVVSGTYTWDIALRRVDRAR
jgi:hypothetical protein